MSAAIKKEGPQLAPGAGKNESLTASLCHVNAPAVKFKDPDVLLCGACPMFLDKPPAVRRHCHYTGESTSRNGECHLDPLSDAYTWVDSLPVGGEI